MNRPSWRVLVALLLAMALAFVPLGRPGAGEAADDEIENPDDVSVVTLHVPDALALETLVDRGYDLDHDVEPAGSGFTVTGIIQNDEWAGIEALGVDIEVEADSAEIEAVRVEMMEQRQETVDANAALAEELELEDIDTVIVARADYFTSTNDTRYLSVEAKSSDAQAATLTVEWNAGDGTAIGDGGSATLGAFIDAGQYMYHRGQIQLGDQLAFTIDSGSAAGSYEAVAASFGPSADTTGVSGAIELVSDGTAAPTEGCGPLVGFTAGSIALVDRGNCPFTQKVGNAQAAGAVGVIVVQNTAGAATAMGGSDPSIVIPAAMITRNDGDAIKAGLPTTGSLAILPPKPDPTMVRVTSSNGGSAEAAVTEWLPTDFPELQHRYFDGFLDHYPDAYEILDMIHGMAEDFPELVEIIELPNETNGYRRPGMNLAGSASASRVGVTSHAWGHEGGNDLTIAYVDPGVADSPLSVTKTGNDIVVGLATDSGAALASTAAQVVAALNANPDVSAVLEAYTYRGNAGTGIVATQAATNLTDGLNAPEYVLREPFTPLMLRIGKVRDGSKTGVFAYSQEHAREWQTPLVSLETAYRLLNNYNTDADTRKLVDNLDIFIIPQVNPDGNLYSFYDFASQRKNMKSYCEVGGSNDYNARNGWGVDNNRNYTAGTLFDGYSGASTNCTSETYAGPSELSEPESKNVYWVAETFDNIEFSMNIHSSGNYFMWAPGAYSVPGRVTLPRPSFGTEQFFFAASSDILTEIKQHRGLAVTPARTGPIADVLYSAAGNSADALYYDFGIYGWSFEVGTSFQPQWDEAYNQMMEFSNGLVGMLDVALEWTRDRQAPTSWVEQSGSGTYSGPVGITFGYDEPVDIYYTLDGSNPTMSSPMYQSAGIREGGETLTISATTTIKWFSVDASGNVEGKYKPGRNNPRTAVITIN